MRKVIVVAACLVLTTTFASAQSSGRDYDRGMTEEERAADEEDERGSYEGERGRRSGMRGGRRHSGPSGGARFIVRSGDTRLSVQCDKRETMQSCVDAALLLFEKVGSKQQIPRINDTPTTPR